MSVTGFLSRHVSEFGCVSAWLLVCLSVCMSSMGVNVYECVTGFVCKWVCAHVCV